MVDTSHLERMGRELKCPICLSLLKSAVSLSCNHAFCNSCIEKSMKAASDCPVCKVPFRRREIRPAPHMDNLVSVYKSMEVASGVNIFVTQNADSTKPSDYQSGAKNCEAKRSVQACEHKIRRKGCKGVVKTNKRPANLDSIKPTFPTKKRVQVPHYSNSEAQMNQEKLEVGSCEINRKEPEKSSVPQKDISCALENGEPVLSPFFWLGEEGDVEKLSQTTDDNQSMYTPPDAPCFSDIKDSDDDDNSNRGSERGTCAPSTGAEFFDSEMFDWTQRPCSPELCSSVPWNQIGYGAELEIQNKAGATLTETTTGPAQGPQNSEDLIKKSISGVKNGKKRTSENKDRHATESKINKRVKKNKGEVTVPHVESETVTHQDATEIHKENPSTLRRKPKKNEKVCSESFKETDVPSLHVESDIATHQEAKESRKENPSTLRRKPKKNEKVCSEAFKETDRPSLHVEPDMVTHQDAKESRKQNPSTLRRKPKKNEKVCSEAFKETDVPSLLQRADSLTNGKEMASIHVTPSVDLRKSSRGSGSSGGSDKSSNKANKTLARSKKRGGQIAANFETTNVHMNIEQPNDVAISITNTNSILLSYENELPDRLGKKHYEENSKKLSSSMKKVKFSTGDNHDGTPLTSKGIAATKGLASEEIQGTTNRNENKVSGRKNNSVNSLDGSFLVKCSTSPGTILCAFCQSSEESQASGIMVHYLNGKLVEDNNNARINAIHVHKNCAEWAPNVYFDDDNVINLETELSRSRRIACSCCGIKGAALGCYDKSCRKSFHVSCARLTPECRWDSDNFVMLCPIHASCLLPNEMPQSQSKQKRTSAIKRKPVVHPVKSTDDSKQDSLLQWKSQKKIKHLVLCCSGLTPAEKEIVTEFEKLSGATMLKNWDPSVTHVITSTDENGACKRTLKFLKGVLEGKWILSVQWIKDCMEAGELVEEQLYEISVDIHGITDGPKLGRLRLLNKQPRLFEGCAFYFMGDFEPSYKGYLHDLVITGGGKVLNRKPVAGDQAIESNRCPAVTTFIVYSLELPDQCSPANASSSLDHRRAQAEALASSTGAGVATNSWILNSISGHRLQEIEERSS